MTDKIARELEWETEEQNWFTAMPNGFRHGYEVRLTDSGKVRVRMVGAGWDYFDGTVEEAKAAYQDHHEALIRSALSPALLSSIEGKEPVAWRYRPDNKAVWQYSEGSQPNSISGWLFEPLYASPAPPVERTDKRAGKRIAPADVYRVLKRHYDEAPITGDDLPRLSREIAALTAIGARDE